MNEIFYDYDYLNIMDDNDLPFHIDELETTVLNSIIERVDNITRNTPDEYLRLVDHKSRDDPDDIRIAVLDSTYCPITNTFHLLYQTVDDILYDKPPKIIVCYKRYRNNKRIVYVI